MPEMQKPVLEHTAPKARQETRELTSVSRTTTLPESNDDVNLVTSVTKAELTLDALNTLGVALTDHHHQWSKRERRLYFGAYRWLTSVCGAGSAA